MMKLRSSSGARVESPPAVQQRTLTPAHARFYAAVVQGVEPQRAWHTYLPVEDEFSTAGADRLIAWVREALIAEALSAGRPADAAVLRRDPRRLVPDTAPSLEAFAADLAREGHEFSEAELTELWREAHGPAAQRLARRDRLVQRLRAALERAAHAPRAVPLPGDPVGLWLAAPLAERLATAGLPTLGAVAGALAARRGRRWPAVAGVGEVWARRLADWLAGHGIAPPPDAAELRTPASGGGQIRPLEQLPYAPPSATGWDRLTPLPLPAVAGTIDGADDRALADAWLADHAASPHTVRRYRRAAERLLLWCRIEGRLPLARLDATEARRYVRWLTMLGRASTADWSAEGWRLPAEAWLAERPRLRRSDPAWRPFDGAMSPAALAQELTVLQVWFHWLRDRGVSAVQPFKGLAAGVAPAEGEARAPAAATASAPPPLGDRPTVRTTGAPAADERPARLALIWWLLRGTGLTASEVVGLTLGACRFDIGGDDGLALALPSRATAARIVPVPSAARRALLAYVAHLGLTEADLRRLSTDPADTRAAEPLLRAQRGRRAGHRPSPSLPMSYSTLQRELATYARNEAGAQETPGGPAPTARHLRAAWACAALAAGSPVASVQRHLGHASALSTLRHAPTAAVVTAPTSVAGDLGVTGVDVEALARTISSAASPRRRNGGRRRGAAAPAPGSA